MCTAVHTDSRTDSPASTGLSTPIILINFYRLHLCDTTSGMALTERLEQHAICGFIKLLFTFLTLQGQLVGGLLAWRTEPEYTGINTQNKEEVK